MPAPVPEPPAPPRVSLRVEIDMEAGVATIELDEGSDRVTLTREGDRWVLGS